MKQIRMLWTALAGSILLAILPFHALTYASGVNPVTNQELQQVLLRQGNENADDLSFLVQVLDNPEPSAIEGRVVDVAGNPVTANVFCVSLRSGVQGLGNAVTDETGHYFVGDLTAGSYYVIVSANGYMPKFYDNVSNAMQASKLELAEGDTVSGVDFVMDVPATGSGSISGTVTRQDDGSPVAGAWIYAFSQDNPLSLLKFFTTSGNDGSYQFVNLPDGNYTVYVQAEGYLPEFYDNANMPAQATKVQIQGGNQVTGIDIALEEGGSISGFVRGPSGEGLAGVKVAALPADFQPSLQHLAASPRFQFAVSDSQGAYTISGLPVGNYKVGAALESDAAPLVQWWDHTQAFDAATPVHVAANENVENINFDFEYLEPTGVVSGHVQDLDGNPLPGVWVVAWSTGDTLLQKLGFLFQRVQTDSSGNYRISNLWPGEYIVSATRWDWNNFQTIWYDGANSKEAATPVQVSPDTPVDGINFSFDRSQDFGSINGHVAYDDGTPVAYALVEAAHASASASTGNGGSHRRPLPAMLAYTDSQGNYRLDYLSPGDYYVIVRKDGYTEYYDDATNAEDATPVTVSGAQTTSGVDFVIPPQPAEGSQISGTVVDDSTGQPIEGAVVSLFPANSTQIDPTQQMYSTATDAEGHYTIAGVPAGSYAVGCWARGYVAEFYDNKTQPQEADVLDLDGTNSHSGIDFALAPAKMHEARFEPNSTVGKATVSGHVTGTDGQAIEGAYVYALDTDGQVVASEITAADGRYSLVGLEPGDYYLLASRAPYSSEYYSNATSLQEATPVSVGDQEGWDATDVNFQLQAETATSVSQRHSHVLPLRAGLLQNYPNPFNPTTVIQYALPKRVHVLLQVFNARGQLVATLVNAEQTADVHHVTWDGTNARGEKVVSGVYFCRLQAGALRQVRRMILLK